MHQEALQSLVCLCSRWALTWCSHETWVRLLRKQLRLKRQPREVSLGSRSIGSGAVFRLQSLILVSAYCRYACAYPALDLTCHYGFAWWSLNSWLNLAALRRLGLLSLFECCGTASLLVSAQLLCLPYAHPRLPVDVGVSWIFHNFMWQESMI